jgi:hypothetical protein
METSPVLKARRAAAVDLVIAQGNAPEEGEEAGATEQERIVPHIVTDEEAAGKAFSIGDVVLPMPGKHVV